MAPERRTASRRRVAARVAARVNALGATPTSGRVVRRRLIGRGSSADLAGVVRGKHALITGASSGIGRAAALQLARAGAVVVLVARSEELLDELAGLIEASGGRALVFACDLTDTDELDAMAGKVLEQLGHIDILVNNAGMSIRRKVRHSADRFQDFERPMNLNYFAAVRLTMRLLPTMVERESGHVINISTWAAVLHPPRFSGYTASKAALEAWSECVQAEVLEDGVAFTNIRMPLVRTPMIAPTKLYGRLPALTPEQAGAVVCEAVVTRSRRVTPLAGTLTQSMAALSPGLGDVIRKYAP